MTTSEEIIRGYVPFEEGQIHYLTAGEGEPIVLFHATSDSATMWEPVLPIFARRGFRAIAVDVPGSGNSTLPREQPDGAGFGRFLAQAMDALGLERFHVLGHHLGASLGAQMVARMGDRVLSFAAYGWPATEKKPYGDVQRNAKPRIFDRNGDEIKRHWVRRWEMSGRELDDPAANRFTEDMGIRTMIALLQCRHWEWLYQAMGNTDHQALAAKVRCPVLLFAGPRDHNYEETKDAEAHFPDARFVDMPEVGVDVADEDPEAFVGVVVNFIRSSAPN
jgi:pimeloyl-ACP methyl ester carboxylesterase